MGECVQWATRRCSSSDYNLIPFYGNSGAGGVHNESCTNIEMIGL